MILDLFEAPTGNPAGAILSDCERYRYRLWRRWEAGPEVAWIMLNPSTADALQDDPTIRKCVGFAKRWGYGGLQVVNLFAFRSTDPAAMRRASAPIGPQNDQHLVEVATKADLVVCAWGTDGAHLGRAVTVRRLMREHGVKLHALRLTKDGEPGHPLYLPFNLRPVEMEVA